MPNDRRILHPRLDCMAHIPLLALKLELDTYHLRNGHCTDVARLAPTAQFCPLVAGHDDDPRAIAHFKEEAFEALRFLFWAAIQEALGRSSEKIPNGFPNQMSSAISLDISIVC